MGAHVGGDVVIGVVVRDSSPGKHPGKTKYRNACADAGDDPASIPDTPYDAPGIRVASDLIGIAPRNKHADAVVGIHFPVRAIRIDRDATNVAEGTTVGRCNPVPSVGRRG